MTYDEEAAAELRKARAANDKRAEVAAELAGTKLPHLKIDAEVADRSMEIFEGFARLAAIKAGLPAVLPPGAAGTRAGPGGVAQWLRPVPPQPSGTSARRTSPSSATTASRAASTSSSVSSCT